MINVTKRNGNLEQYNVIKIKNCIKHACEGLDANPLALESAFDKNLYDKITTKKINKNLIHHAVAMASPDESDWVYVAGRLETMELWADTGSYDIPFIDFFKKQIKQQIWTHPAFQLYTDEDLNQIGEYIKRDNDLNHSYASVLTAKQKYLLSNECIQHMFIGNAMIIASIETKHRLQFLKEVYDALSERKLSLATPFLSNLRDNGNVSSCFIIEPEDDLDSIYDNLKNAAKISKNGGGVGISLARIRASGSLIQGKLGRAGGIIGWNTLFNYTAVYVDQKGKRSGSFTMALPIWHGDIEEFLQCQSEVGDLRRKAFDIKPQVTVNDLFMVLKDDSNNDWHTFCPHEVKIKLGFELYSVYGKEFENLYYKCVEEYKNGTLKVCRVYKAKELWKLVLKMQFETGMPYTTYFDTLNEGNPNKHKGIIPCFNLCTESTSVVIPDTYAHTCNLLSLVLGRIEIADLSKYAALATKILDYGITLTNSPIAISSKHNEVFRTIGVGQQGLHDLLAREFSNYNDLDLITEVSERIQYGCVLQSIELAKDLGKYPFFKGSEWDNGNMISNYASKSVTNLDWKGLQPLIDENGIRNSQLTSPPPNTSSSIFMDAAAGIMPVYSAFFYEENKNGILPVSSMHLKLNPLSYAKDVTKHDPVHLTKVVERIQWFVDTGISAEYIMDKNIPDFKASNLWNLHQAAWKNKNKAVYYIRTVKKGDKLIQGDAGCVGCAG